MKEQFIPYEQALKLKELGFNEECLGVYGKNGNFCIRINDYRFENGKINEKSEYIIRNFNAYNNGSISAPLWQQAFDWFRINYGLVIEISPKDNKQFNSNITDLGGWQSYFHTNYIFETYEEARLECLNKLIEVVSAV